MLVRSSRLRPFLESLSRARVYISGISAASQFSIILSQSRSSKKSLISLLFSISTVFEGALIVEAEDFFNERSAVKSLFLSSLSSTLTFELFNTRSKSTVRVIPLNDDEPVSLARSYSSFPEGLPERSFLTSTSRKSIEVLTEPERA